MSYMDILKYVVPFAFYNRLKSFLGKRTAEVNFSQFRAEVGTNVRFHNLHNNNRCFIMCNGPSINKQDLLPLKDEIVFSVSNGYYHKDYLTIGPRYHCVPQITYNVMTEKDVVLWFGEMHERLGDAEVFLSTTEKTIIEHHGLFPGRKVNYLHMSGSFVPNQSSIYDISRPLPGVQSVAIMCLLIAMFMGFDKIYLVGTEHDSFKGEYRYFYDTALLDGKDPHIVDDRKVKSMYDELVSSLGLWQQYRALKIIAAANNIQIYNATLGGALDEFERVALESLFRK